MKLRGLLGALTSNDDEGDGNIAILSLQFALSLKRSRLGVGPSGSESTEELIGRMKTRLLLCPF